MAGDVCENVRENLSCIGSEYLILVVGALAAIATGVAAAQFYLQLY